MHLSKCSFRCWEVKVAHQFFWPRFVSAGSRISVPSVYHLRWYVGGSIKRSCHPPWQWRACSCFCGITCCFKNSRYHLIKILLPVQPCASGVMHRSQHCRRRIGFFLSQEKFGPTTCFFRIRWVSFKYSKLPTELACWRKMLSVQAIRKCSIKVQKRHTRIQPGTFQD